MNKKIIQIFVLGLFISIGFKSGTFSRSKADVFHPDTKFLFSP